MQKIKKVSALILIMIMVLSLSACGALEAADQRLSVRLKGDGSKTLRLSVFTELPEGVSTKYIQEKDEGGNDTIVITEKTTKAKGTLKYNIKSAPGVASGMYTTYIQYVDSKDEVYAGIMIIAGISEKGKFTVHEIRAEGKDEFIPIAENNEYTEYTEEPEIDIEVRNNDSNFKDLKLPYTKGSWQVDETSYNPELLLVSERESEYEGYQMFRVTGLKIGVSDLVMFNESDEVQIKLSFAAISGTESSEYTEDQAVDYLDITSSEKLPYDKTKTPEYVEDHATAAAMIRRILPDAYIPSGLAFDQCFVYNFGAVDRGVEFVEYKAAVDAYNNAPEEEKEKAQKAIDDLLSGCNSADIVFEIDDRMFGLTVTNARNADELFKFVTTEVNYSEAKEMTVGEKTVKYFIADEGFGGAVFEDANYRYGVIGMDEFTDESFVSCINQLLSLPNE